MPSARKHHIIRSILLHYDASTLDSAHRQTILERARGLFYDSDPWPAQRSLYYIGAFEDLEDLYAGVREGGVP
jgi:hypothetical protein